ncbi:hypothetical protein B0A49_09244 [Cryomyces minteri]|uniref:Transcriptional coactivator HFI1/ADA1 n=1 Tax=Cryomyces minteri TaxID=331657 RepID=A0A4U0WQ27_9PEZI|nr:hypothetical protein B0A49_09244 [Cryomyces minteri]
MNPADLTRSDSISHTNTTPTTIPKSLGPPSSAPQKNGKALVTAPRIDVEPLYTALKAQIGEHWATYKDAISHFILGHLHQFELSHRIRPFIALSSSTEHLHNQLICAIYGNISRDPPESGVASWVSANDKPTATVSKAVVGDKAEERLKAEVMALPARDRRRLKGIKDEPGDTDGLMKDLVEYKDAKTITLPDIVPASAGGFNKTNWEIEIRKRYNLSLSSESLEFPDAATIQARMEPICYEEGLVGGVSNYTTSNPSGPTGPSSCADLVNVATEMFVKEALSNFLTRVRSNGDHYIMTSAYKRQLESEEDAWLRGDMTKNPGGLLPVQIDGGATRVPLSIDGLRLALQIGDEYLEQVPLIADKIMSGGYLDGELEGREGENDEPPKSSLAVNGASAANANAKGIKDEEMLDEDDWGWAGGTASDRDALMSVLDECLAFA